jgi:excisionase family DNA binding protein
VHFEVSLVAPFPNCHSRLYSHRARCVIDRLGKPAANRKKDRCMMAAKTPAESTGDSSDIKFRTVAEVAAMMRVSKMTVYRMVHNGEIPALRVGRSFRVREEDVNEYLRKSFFNAG